MAAGKVLPSVFENAEAMEKVLARMAELMVSDEAMIAASQRKGIALAYDFPDLGVWFYTRFVDGRVEAGLGKIDGADCQVTMNSDVYDGLFTGKVNAAQAAMLGDLMVTGNLAAAMRLQGLMKDFSRLYQLAKG